MTTPSLMAYEGSNGCAFSVIFAVFWRWRRRGNSRVRGAGPGRREFEGSGVTVIGVCGDQERNAVDGFRGQYSAILGELEFGRVLPDW